MAALADESSPGLTAKRMSGRELRTLMLVDQRLPGLTARLSTAAPMGTGSDPDDADDWLVVMERRGGDTLTRRLDGRASSDRDVLDRTLERLALLHQTFLGCGEDLARLGLRPAPILSKPPPGRSEIDEVLAACAQFSRWPLGEELAAASGTLERDWRFYVDRLADSRRHTLAHGDLHFDNVVVDARGLPAIIDWGCALIAHPCWDLVFCGPRELSVYRARTAVAGGDVEAFLTDLLAALAVRMFELLAAACDCVRGGVEPDGVGPAARVLLSNLCLVNRSPFRGGLGFARGEPRPGRAAKIVARKWNPVAEPKSP